MRLSPSQTAKSEMEASGGKANRYLPSSVCEVWLSKICKTRTRACWLSISTSTFITCSESVAGSGLLPDEGIRTPDCAAPWRSDQQSENSSARQIISRDSLTLIGADLAFVHCAMITCPLGINIRQKNSVHPLCPLCLGGENANEKHSPL